MKLELIGFAAYAAACIVLIIFGMYMHGRAKMAQENTIAPAAHCEHDMNPHH